MRRFIAIIVALAALYTLTPGVDAQVYVPGAQPYTATSPVPAGAGGIGSTGNVGAPPSGRVVMDGDSYMTGSLASSCPGDGGNTNGITPYYTQVANASLSSGTCIGDRIATYYGANEVNMAVYSSCLEATTTSGSDCNVATSSASPLISRYTTSVTHLQCGDNVYLMIGLNDVRNVTKTIDTQVTLATYAANLHTVATAYLAAISGSGCPATLQGHLIFGEMQYVISASGGTDPRLELMFNAAVASEAVADKSPLAVTYSAIARCALVSPSDAQNCIGYDDLHTTDNGYASFAALFEAANYANALTIEATDFATLASIAPIYNAQYGPGIGNGNHNSTYGSGAGPFGVTPTTSPYPVSDVGIGTYACHSITTGSYDVCIGDHAGQGSATGINNISIGYDAGYNNGPNYSIFIGTQAGYAMTGGSYAVGVGHGAISACTTCTSFTAVGGNSLLTAGASATHLTALGYNSGRYISGGATANAASTTSTYLGEGTMALASGDANETVVGYNTIGVGSNTVTLGNTSVTKVASTGYIAPTNGFSDTSSTCTGNSFCRAALVAGTYTWTFGHAWTNVPACIVTEESTVASHTASGVPAVGSVVVTSLVTTGNTDFVDIMCGGRNG